MELSGKFESTCRIIARMLDKDKTISVEAFGSKSILNASEAEGILQELLLEVLHSLGNLEEIDRKLFNVIRAARGGRTVNEVTRDVFGHDFKRAGEELERFRKLRAQKLIRPAEGGTWRSEKCPVPTRLVELILRVKPDALAGAPRTTIQFS